MIMKPVKSKMKIHLSDGRITNAIVLEDGSCELTVMDNNVEAQNIEIHKESKISYVFKDESFVLVEASKLSLNDKFMQHRTTSDNQWNFKMLLTEAIKSGLSDFWYSNIDPSFNEERNGLVFEAGKKPAVGKSYNWWEEKAMQYMPERGSHLGTRTEYVAFLGVLIKQLVAGGWFMSKAWEAVCDESVMLGHSWYGKGIYHLRALADTRKFLADDKNTGKFWCAGGHFYYSIYVYGPLAVIYQGIYRDCHDRYSVGWIVLSK